MLYSYSLLYLLQAKVNNKADNKENKKEVKNDKEICTYVPVKLRRGNTAL